MARTSKGGSQAAGPAALDEQQVAAVRDELALRIGDTGLPPIGARMIAHLVVCEPAHQTPAQIAAAIGASKASVSTMLQLLQGVQLVERAPVTVARATCFRLRDDGFAAVFERKLESVSAFRRAAEQALAVLGPGPRSSRLAALHELHLFWEAEMPPLIARWHARARGGASAAPATAPAAPTRAPRAAAATRTTKDATRAPRRR